MSIILGIESTAHTFGVGIVKNGKVLSNARDMYSTESGGIIPIESAKHHSLKKNELYFEALDFAGVKENEIDAIAFSKGPGLSPCLLEGMKFAKELSERLKKPIVPVNHCIAHLEIGAVTGAKDPVMLYVSGANTQIIAYAAGKYRIFGETLDLGVGNFIDTVARFAGIGFPGGPAIEKLARAGKKYIELPYTIKGMDISLSGIQTKIKQLIEKLPALQIDTNASDISQGASQKNNYQDNSFVGRNVTKSILKLNNFNRDKKPDYTLADIAYSMQETVFAMLVETAERALAHTGKKELLLGGGVACNSRLQEMCRIMCEERGCKLFVPERSLLVDNGAFIAFTGELMYKKGVFVDLENIDSIDILPRQRTDQVDVKWK